MKSLNKHRLSQFVPAIRQEFVPVILQVIVLCVLLAHSAASLIEWYIQLGSPSDLDFAERWHAYIAYQAYPGGEHVNSAYEIPYNALPYPPISYLLHGWIGRLVRTDLLGMRTIGRTISLIMTLLNSIIIIQIGRVLRVRLLLSVMAGLLFLTSGGANFFAVSLRPDEMACALALLGLYVVLRGPNYWLAGTLFSLALATKHSFVSIPLVLIVALFLQRDVRSVMKLLISGCLVGLLIISLGTWMLGPYWWQGCLLQGFHGADLKQAIFFVGKGFSQPVLVVGLASVLLSGLSRSVRTIAACFVVSLALNSVALIKVGAAENYFLEPVALAAILVVCAAQQMLDEQRLVSRGFAWVLILGLMIPSTVEQTIATVHSLKTQGNNAPDERALVELVRSVDRPILTDIGGLYFDSGHKPSVCPPDLIMAAVEAGKIDGRPMQQFIEQQGFNAIVVRTNWKEVRHFPQTWISAIEENYEHLGVVDGFNVMKPKST